jgi:hypothetical protein
MEIKWTKPILFFKNINLSYAHTEKLNYRKRTYTGKVDLGPESRSGSFQFAWERVQRRPGKQAHEDHDYGEFHAARERLLTRAEEAKDYLTKRGIDTQIEQETVDGTHQEDRNSDTRGACALSIGILAVIGYGAHLLYQDRTIEGHVIKTHNYGWRIFGLQITDDFSVFVRSGSTVRELENVNSPLHWTWSEDRMQEIAEAAKDDTLRVRATYEGGFILSDGHLMSIDTLNVAKNDSIPPSSGN